MRHPFTTETAKIRGYTPSSLRWAVRQGRLQQPQKGIYLDGPAPSTPLERCASLAVATNGVALGAFAAQLHELDAVALNPPFVAVPIQRRSRRDGACVATIDESAIVTLQGLRCTDGAESHQVV